MNIFHTYIQTRCGRIYSKSSVWMKPSHIPFYSSCRQDTRKTLKQCNHVPSETGTTFLESTEKLLEKDFLTYGQIVTCQFRWYVFHILLWQKDQKSEYNRLKNMIQVSIAISLLGSRLLYLLMDGTIVFLSFSVLVQFKLYFS